MPRPPRRVLTRREEGWEEGDRVKVTRLAVHIVLATACKQPLPRVSLIEA